ncbi:MAG: hypothetical protein KME25_07500 [Symplocastrum torsivum CPER-KK1]|uniref:DUF11 domain-containing protein n=1 Tax=Symplocastrum torsivum CPER-KK1 TaxID=450513 RepID=A0A951PHY6_9CYAN|nr:hypothetical protein [Symplocastrum torsivum CPER-KK1]
MNGLAKKRWKYARPLITTALLVSGIFQLAKPVLAQVATPAPPGTEISNTATATYEDPANPGVAINATSNTVVIQIAEVAGITVTPADVPTTDVNGGTVQPGNIVNYDFTVTNVGNDPTTIFIPGTATVTNGTAGTLQYSTDGVNFTDVPAAGVATPSINPGATVIVRVPVTVNLNAQPEDEVTVVLGNTGPNDNSAATQNQPDADGTDGADEVRTIDNVGTANGDASPAAPANREREASASQSVTVGALVAILNAPDNAPEAVGPDGTTDTDFTNASTTVPPGIPQDTPANPEPRTITNTVQNSSTTDPVIISLLPTPPANPGDLPLGTVVTITIPTTGDIARYTYTATGFEFVEGTGTSATDPPKLTLQPNGSPDATADYQVTIDLPANTPQLTGYPVPITAFTDTDGDGLPTAGEPANITIDRLFTGFLSLVKAARILAADGTTVIQDFTTETALLSAQTAPGNIIEYRVTYANVAPAVDPAATGSINLTTANNLVITEDGTTNGNNWALDGNGDGVLDTINIPGTAADSSGGTITTTPSGDGEDVTQYVDTVVEVAPGGTGTFTFQRRLP